MKQSEDLFDLIKSLAKTEKGYFKKYSRLHVRGENNNYILLFDAIDSQKKYDEGKLLSKFKSYDFTRQFSVAKNYLYHQVLYAMESYHQSVHTDVRSLIHRTEFLYEKGLYKQAYKTLAKAKETATANDMYWSLLELFRHWEMNLSLKSPDSRWTEKILDEESSVLKLIHNTKIYRDLFFKMALLHNAYGVARDKKHLKEIKKIIRSPHLSDESKALTFEARLRFHDTYVFYAETLADQGKTLLYSEKIIRHFKSHPEKIKQNVLSYIGYLNNMLVSCSRVNKFKEAGEYIDELGKLSTTVKGTPQRVKLFYTLYYNQLNLLNNSGRFSDATAFMNVIRKFIAEHETKLSDFEKTILYANISIVYFGCEQYKESILWLNKIRNETSLPFRTDIESFLRVFYLVAHYEAGNEELLPYLVQSTYRFLRKKERLYVFEKRVIDFLRKQQSVDTKEKLLQSFKKLKDLLVPLQKDKYEKNAFEFFDFVSWLDSKIENKPLSEILKRKMA